MVGKGGFEQETGSQQGTGKGSLVSVPSSLPPYRASWAQRNPMLKLQYVGTL